MRTVDPADLKKHEEFLSNDKTGIFKLLPNFDCITKDLIRVDGECARFMPDMSDFSFRTKNYSEPDYHDIRFSGDEIISNGPFSHGILTALGDVPIEQVNATSAGLKFLVDFRPDVEPAAAGKTAEKLSGGNESGGYRYSTSVKADVNSTFALRFVAYRIGNSLPQYPSSLAQQRFLQIVSEKRSDVTIVFRIVGKGADGSVTILWKELERRKAPAIKFAKGSVLADFKPPTVD
jgi:hypothetical protein